MLFAALAECGPGVAVLTLVGPQPIDWKARAGTFGSAEQVHLNSDYFQQQEIVQLQSEADVLVDIANIVPQHIGGKFFEYLSTNKPILYVTQDRNDEKAQVIREYKAGFVCTTVEEIVAAIQQVKAQIQQSGTARRERVRDVGFDERAERYWNLIYTLRG